MHTRTTTGRRPQKSGAAKATEKLGGLVPGTRGQKRRASAGPGKKGAAGLALLAGAAGLLVKNRERLTAMIGHGDSSNSPARPVEPHASTSGPVDPAAIPNPLASPDHPAA